MLKPVIVYHVLNQAVGRTTLCKKAADYAAFEKILGAAHERLGTRLLAFVLLPNHWHLIVWPKRAGELTTYLQWLTVSHVRRWHADHHTVGTGPIYQGRFKSFPIHEDEHFLTVCRYVERNPLRANLVPRAESWRWSSLWHRVHQTKGTVVGRLAHGRADDLDENAQSSPENRGIGSRASLGAAWSAVWLRTVATTNGCSPGLAVVVVVTGEATPNEG